MLGLGDIVIPGLFIALLLRWDVTRQRVRYSMHALTHRNTLGHIST
jgi:hypothetical protein